MDISSSEFCGFSIQLIRKFPRKKYKNVFGIPKNGTIVATDLSFRLGVPLVGFSEIGKDTLIVDDIYDSGKTLSKYPKNDALVVISKTKKLPENVKYVGKFVSPTTWVNWFWEHEDHDKEQTVTRMLQQLGEDSGRDGLVDTPRRVVKSFDKLYGGYKQSGADILKVTFSSQYDEVILLRDIPLFSTCEHHVLPFFGKCHIGYIPGASGRVVGISKLVRLMEVYSRRLQIQEQLTIQIGNDLVTNLKPKAVGVIIQAQHMCMTARGVEKAGSSMVTSFMWGAFKENVASRQEFLNLIKL